MHGVGGHRAAAPIPQKPTLAEVSEAPAFTYISGLF